MRYSEPVQTGLLLKLWQLCHHPVSPQAWQDSGKAWNRRTTDYHTAPSLASRCRLMGSWKVKMKKWFSLHDSPVLSFSPSITLLSEADVTVSVCLALSSFLFTTSPQVRPNREWERESVEEAGVVKIIKTVRLFQTNSIQGFWICRAASCLVY